jgi:NhaA family Na+:H+ antiporter
MISLEVKRELLVGEINSVEKILLPVIAALGGITAPAVIYESVVR